MLIVFYPFIKKKRIKKRKKNEMDAFDLLVVPRVDKQNPNDTHGFIKTATQERKKRKKKKKNKQTKQNKQTNRSCGIVRCFHVSPRHIVGIQIRCT